MRNGQRSRSTRDREDLAEHLRIKPKATEPPGPTRQNDAHQRLQLAPSDPRWEMAPPYGWVEKHPGDSLSNGLTLTRCWFCALSVQLQEHDENDQPFLYSKKLSMVAHVECAAGDDGMIGPKRATIDST